VVAVRKFVGLGVRGFSLATTTAMNRFVSRCIVLLQQDMNRSNFRHNNMLDITIDLREPKRRALGKAA